MRPNVRVTPAPLAVGLSEGLCFTHPKRANVGTQRHDYTELDTAIVAQIKAGSGSFTAMSAALADAAKPFVQDPHNPRACPAPTWRVVDRRLQALRTRGVIKYSRADLRWHAA